MYTYKNRDSKTERKNEGYKNREEKEKEKSHVNYA